MNNSSKTNGNAYTSNSKYFVSSSHKFIGATKIYPPKPIQHAMSYIDKSPSRNYSDSQTNSQIKREGVPIQNRNLGISLQNNVQKQQKLTNQRSNNLLKEIRKKELSRKIQSLKYQSSQMVKKFQKQRDNYYRYNQPQSLTNVRQLQHKIKLKLEQKSQLQKQLEQINQQSSKMIIQKSELKSHQEDVYKQSSSQLKKIQSLQNDIKLYQKNLLQLKDSYAKLYKLLKSTQQQNNSIQKQIQQLKSTNTNKSLQYQLSKVKTQKQKSRQYVSQNQLQLKQTIIKLQETVDNLQQQYQILQSKWKKEHIVRRRLQNNIFIRQKVYQKQKPIQYLMPQNQSKTLNSSISIKRDIQKIEKQMQQIMKQGQSLPKYEKLIDLAYQWSDQLSNHEFSSKMMEQRYKTLSKVYQHIINDIKYTKAIENKSQIENIYTFACAELINIQLMKERPNKNYVQKYKDILLNTYNQNESNYFQEKIVLLNNLALFSEKETRNIRQIQVLYEQIVDLEEKYLNKSDERMIITKNNLACLYAENRKLDQALKIFSWCLNIIQKFHLGNDLKQLIQKNQQKYVPSGYNPHTYPRQKTGH